MTTASIAKPKGREKAAILVLALGPDLSAEVLKHCSEDIVDRLTREVFIMQKVSESVKQQVMEECYQDAIARNFISTGGAEYARIMLLNAFGPERAGDVMARIAATTKPHPFDFLKDSDPVQLVGFIQGEHPQTIALILSHLDPRQASAILSSLEAELQADVAIRIASMDRTPPEIVERVEEVLKKRTSLVLDRGYSSTGGVEFLVKILSSVDRGTEKGIFERLDESDPDLAADVRKLMFVFDDISKLDDRSLQRVLREIDFRDLALALRGTNDDLRNRIFKNLSSRSAEMLKDEMNLSGPVRIRNVEEAQQRIVAIVRRLDEAEEIYISRGSEDVIV